MKETLEHLFYEKFIKYLSDKDVDISKIYECDLPIVAFDCNKNYKLLMWNQICDEYTHLEYVVKVKNDKKNYNMKRFELNKKNNIDELINILLNSNKRIGVNMNGHVGNYIDKMLTSNKDLKGKDIINFKWKENIPWGYLEPEYGIEIKK